MSLYKKFISNELSINYLNLIRDSSPWSEGIKSRNGISRLQCQYHILPDYIKEIILDLVNEAFTQLNFTRDENNGIGIDSIYLNYYRDGNDFCPKHQHLGTKQLLISLGSERNLYINNKVYKLESGSVIIFGEEFHQIKKEENIGERISIVVFY